MPVHNISATFFGNLNVEWPCPERGQKTLLIGKASFKSESLLKSRQAYGEDWFDADMDKTVFSCMAHCSRASCGEVVACIGQGGDKTGMTKVTKQSTTPGISLSALSQPYTHGD